MHVHETFLTLMGVDGAGPDAREADEEAADPPLIAAAVIACALRLSSSLHPIFPASPTSTGAGCWNLRPIFPSSSFWGYIRILRDGQSVNECSDQLMPLMPCDVSMLIKAKQTHAWGWLESTHTHFILAHT